MGLPETELCNLRCKARKGSNPREPDCLDAMVVPRPELRDMPREEVVQELCWPGERFRDEEQEEQEFHRLVPGVKEDGREW